MCNALPAHMTHAALPAPLSAAGAYTVAGACDFNGINMTQPLKYYVYSMVAVDTAEIPLGRSDSLTGPALEVIDEL